MDLISRFLSVKNALIAVAVAFLVGNLSGCYAHRIWVKAQEKDSLVASAKDSEKKRAAVRDTGDSLEAAKTQYQKATQDIKRTEKNNAPVSSGFAVHDAERVQRIEERLSAAEAAVERIK